MAGKRSSVVSTTMVPDPVGAVERVLANKARYECACCGGPTVPVLEWHPPTAEQPGYYLCHHCAQKCKAEARPGAIPRFEHVVRAPINWAEVNRRWSADLGFKKLTAG